MCSEPEPFVEAGSFVRRLGEGCVVVVESCGSWFVVVSEPCSFVVWSLVRSFVVVRVLVLELALLAASFVSFWGCRGGTCRRTEGEPADLKGSLLYFFSFGFVCVCVVRPRPSSSNRVSCPCVA